MTSSIADSLKHVEHRPEAWLNIPLVVTQSVGSITEAITAINSALISLEKRIRDSETKVKQDLESSAAMLSEYSTKISGVEAALDSQVKSMNSTLATFETQLNERFSVITARLDTETKARNDLYNSFSSSLNANVKAVEESLERSKRDLADSFNEFKAKADEEISALQVSTTESLVQFKTIVDAGEEKLASAAESSRIAMEQSSSTAALLTDKFSWLDGHLQSFQDEFRRREVEVAAKTEDWKHSFIAQNTAAREKYHGELKAQINSAVDASTRVSQQAIRQATAESSRALDAKLSTANDAIKSQMGELALQNTELGDALANVHLTLDAVASKQAREAKWSAQTAEKVLGLQSTLANMTKEQNLWAAAGARPSSPSVSSVSSRRTTLSASTSRSAPPPPFIDRSLQLRILSETVASPIASQSPQSPTTAAPMDSAAPSPASSPKGGMATLTPTEAAVLAAAPGLIEAVVELAALLNQHGGVDAISNLGNLVVLEARFTERLGELQRALDELNDQNQLAGMTEARLVALESRVRINEEDRLEAQTSVHSTLHNLSNSLAYTAKTVASKAEASSLDSKVTAAAKSAVFEATSRGAAKMPLRGLAGSKKRAI